MNGCRENNHIKRGEKKNEKGEGGAHEVPRLAAHGTPKQMVNLLIRKARNEVQLRVWSGRSFPRFLKEGETGKNSEKEKKGEGVPPSTKKKYLRLRKSGAIISKERERDTWRSFQFQQTEYSGAVS